MNTHCNTEFGILYIVATPIGNLSDISMRAIETLRTVHHIAAEDTRESKKLLDHFGISKPLIALHDHNESERSKHLIQLLKNGESIALISDAGTPLISDPGYHLVHQARTMGIRVSPIPGCCALIAALCASGIACNTFYFHGFLPAKPKGRIDALTALAKHSATLIFYESTHRIIDSLSDMATVFGNRTAVIARELTKNFEQIHSDHLPNLIEWITEDHYRTKGEFVIIIEGSTEHKNPRLSDEARRCLHILQRELPLKKAATITSEIFNAKKNELYQLGLDMQKTGR